MEYNLDLPHQALGTKAPDEVHQSASEGAAMIVDKYGAKEGLSIVLCSSVTAFRKAALNKKRYRIYKNLKALTSFLKPECSLFWQQVCLVFGRPFMFNDFNL